MVYWHRFPPGKKKKFLPEQGDAGSGFSTNNPASPRKFSTIWFFLINKCYEINLNKNLRKFGQELTVY
jgi:hypothetical protein